MLPERRARAESEPRITDGRSGRSDADAAPRIAALRSLRVSWVREPTSPLLANLANPRIVGRSVVAIRGLKHLLLLGSVYAQLQATGAMRGPAFMRREVSWPRSAAPCCSPPAGKPAIDCAHLLAHELGAPRQWPRPALIRA